MIHPTGFLLLTQLFKSWYFVQGADTNGNLENNLNTDLNIYIKLLCVESHSITIQWGLTGSKNPDISEPVGGGVSYLRNSTIYIRAIRDNETANFKVENSTQFTFPSLRSNTEYEFSVHGAVFRGNKILSYKLASSKFFTAHENLKYAAPRLFTVRKIFSTSPTKANVLVSWQPPITESSPTVCTSLPPFEYFPPCGYEVSWSYLLNSSHIIVKAPKYEELLKNLAFNVCYNLSILSIPDSKINAMNKSYIYSFCPMSEGRNFAGVCICDEMKCSVSINWIFPKVSSGYIATSIFLLDSPRRRNSSSFKNILPIKANTVIEFSSLKTDSIYELVTTENGNKSYEKRFLTHSNSECLLFIPGSPKIRNLKSDHSCHAYGPLMCNITIVWEAFEISASQISVEILGDTLKILFNRTFNNMEYYRLDDYHVFALLLAAAIGAFEQPFEVFVLSGFIFITAFWSSLLIIIRFCKRRRISKIENCKKVYKISVKNTEILHSVGNKKHNKSNSHKLFLGKILGSGAFGIVFEGTLKLKNGEKIHVAVKTVRENASCEEMQLLEKEIMLMESVGFHQNVVSIIGSSCNGARPLLIVEYCHLGDLHTYLNKKRNGGQQILGTGISLDASYSYSNFADFHDQKTNFAENKIYGFYKKKEVVHGSELTIGDLLSFGRQVAIGMEYLASIHVVHRDLAARNVLLCVNRMVKISDFGLSRDIYTDNIYRKTDGKELMPIKWMSIESICHQVYTTETDIWSFGVFLWELFELGKEPYGDITCPEILLLRLKRGDRLPCPPLAEQQLYRTMLNCWSENPVERHSFSMLREELEGIMLSIAPNHYVSLI